jgi:hypothetical protein
MPNNTTKTSFIQIFREIVTFLERMISTSSSLLFSLIQCAKTYKNDSFTNSDEKLEFNLQNYSKFV